MVTRNASIGLRGSSVFVVRVIEIGEATRRKSEGLTRSIWTAVSRHLTAGGPCGRRGEGLGVSTARPKVAADAHDMCVFWKDPHVKGAQLPSCAPQAPANHSGKRSGGIVWSSTTMPPCIFVSTLTSPSRVIRQGGRGESRVSWTVNFAASNLRSAECFANINPPMWLGDKAPSSMAR